MGTFEETEYVKSQPLTPVADPIQDGELSDPEAAELNRKLGESLSHIARQGGPTSWVAGKMANVGKWLQREVDERRQTIGGIDNMWLLMADATDCDFNPVGPTSSDCLPFFPNITVIYRSARVHILFGGS